MKLLSIFLLSFSLLFSSPFAQAEAPLCDSSGRGEVADVSFQTACALMKNYADKTSGQEQISKAISKCALGVGSGAIQGLWMTVEDLGAFLKLAVVEAPAWLWSKAKSVVASYWTQAPDAVSGASAAAAGNIEEQRSILEKARALMATVTDFKEQLIKSYDENKKKFACLPPEDKTALICETLSSFVTNALSGGILIKGISKASVTAEALSEFLRKADRMEKMQGMTAAEKLKAASGLMASVEERGKVLRKIGDSDLVQYTNIKGEKYLKVEDYAVNARGERVVVSSREIMQDSKTLAIDANQEQGRRLLEKAVQGKAGEDSSLIFVDVNNLGKTNYFKDGTKAGDDYLRGVGEAIRKSVGEQDMVFKLGGDEMAIVVKSKDPKVVQQIAMRVVSSVDANHDARTVFRAEQVRQANKYRAVAKAEKVEDVPDEIASALTTSQKETAKKDFAAFKSDYLTQQAEAVREQAKYRPSVSIGSTIGRGDTLENVLQRAEQQATQSKIKYKSEIGLDTKKYGGTDEITPRPNYRAQPEVMPPVE